MTTYYKSSNGKNVHCLKSVKNILERCQVAGEELLTEKELDNLYPLSGRKLDFVKVGLKKSQTVLVAGILMAESSVDINEHIVD